MEENVTRRRRTRGEKEMRTQKGESELFLSLELFQKPFYFYIYIYIFYFIIFSDFELLRPHGTAAKQFIEHFRHKFYFIFRQLFTDQYNIEGSNQFSLPKIWKTV